MSSHGRQRDGRPILDFVDRAGTDPELLRSGHIPDPQPEHTPLFRWLARILRRVEEFLRARGGRPLRAAIRVFWGLVALVGIVLLVGPTINKPMVFEDVIAASKFEDVDWVAQDASFDFEVSRDGGGGFVVDVEESYTANFVHDPENAVVRSLITEVHGHDARFELTSAAVDGVPVDPEVERNATTTDITIRTPGGEKFEGKREISLSYRLHHLVKETGEDAAGTPVDEWVWPVFAPSWTQATSGLDVSITMPRDLDDELVQTPYATVGWLLVTGNVWLDPDEETAEWVRYAFSNDNNLPPNSDVWFRFLFADGTFVQPPLTTLFWWQTWGPLLPLAALGVLMLFGLAARWVVWADTAGEPWYLARSEPPDDLASGIALAPGLAAQLLRKPRHAELVSELESSRRGDRRDGWLRAVAQAGRRAGRIGNLPSTVAWAARWRARDRPVENGLRWVPDSYVRDTFVWGSIAVTLLQWGILRQLSQQFIMLVVWWPFAFVAASTVLAGVTLWAVLRPRPLTRAGALAVQQLKGIDVYARVTRTLDRGPVDDDLIPYAVLFEPARRAGEAVEIHAIRETGERDVTRGWRTEHFLSAPSLGAFALAVATFAGAIVVASTQPAPYGSDQFLTGPESGCLASQIEGFDIEAELTRDIAGAARLDVVEHLTVGFDAYGSSVPQLEREWPRTRVGQALGLDVQSVRIEGESVPFVMTDGVRTSSLVTQLTDVLDGSLDVEIEYSLASPAVEILDRGDATQQVRWTALHWFWDDTYGMVDEATDSTWQEPVRPIRVQLGIAPDLVGELRSGGWIAHGDAEKLPYESGTGRADWVSEANIYVDAPPGEFGGDVDHELRVGSEVVRADGGLVVTLDVGEIESSTPCRPRSLCC